MTRRTYRRIPRTPRSAVARARSRGGFKPFKPSGGWAGVFVPNTTLPGNSKLLLATFTPVAGSVLQTIRRLRMSVMWSSDSVAAIEFPIGAIGAVVVNDLAITAGVASLPDPITEIGDDAWFLFQGLHLRTVFLDATGFASPAGQVYEVDSKAMRKLPDGFSVAIIAATGDAQGAQIQLVARMYTTIARG